MQNTARDTVSETDRKHLNERADKADERMAGIDSQIRVFDASLKEVETQFRSSDQARNIQFANQLRWDSILFEKCFPGSRFPSQIQYYPGISDGVQQK